MRLGSGMTGVTGASRGASRVFQFARGASCVVCSERSSFDTQDKDIDLFPPFFVKVDILCRVVVSSWLVCEWPHPSASLCESL